MRFIPDIAGLLIIALFSLLGSWVVPDEQLRSPMWFFIFLAFAAIGLYYWRNGKSPANLSGWLSAALGSIALGAIFFGVDMLIGHAAHPEMSLITAATHAGSAFGFVFTFFICPCMTIICLAGAVRVVVVSRIAKNA